MPVETHSIMQQNNALLPDMALGATLDQLRNLVEPVTETTSGAHTVVSLYIVSESCTILADLAAFQLRWHAGCARPDMDVEPAAAMDARY
jgi:hypothetical protein